MALTIPAAWISKPSPNSAASGFPIHTIGFGREKATKDVEISDVTVARPRPSGFAPSAARSASIRGLHRAKGQDHGEGRLKIVVATDIVTLKEDGAEQTETFLFNAGRAGVKSIETSIDPLQGEENAKNNLLTRLVNVDARKPRILYFEGEPRWEFKFLRRAVEDDAPSTWSRFFAPRRIRSIVRALRTPTN